MKVPSMKVPSKLKSKERCTRDDVIRLHLAIRDIISLYAAREMGVKIRRVDTLPGKPVGFSQTLFEPAKGPDPKRDAENPGSSRTALLAPSVTVSSSVAEPSLTDPDPALGDAINTDTIPTVNIIPPHPGPPARPSSWGSIRPPPSDYAERFQNGKGLEYVAQKNGHAMPILPNSSEPPRLTNGVMRKGKWRSNNLELMEDKKWEITRVLEDTTYMNPHAIAEILVTPQSAQDEAFLTAGEVRAIIQILKIRVDMHHYEERACLPVLLLSYIGPRPVTGMECKTGRIVQAYHDGRQLVIEYSHRFNLIDEDMAPASLALFARYYLSEPKMVKALAGKDYQQEESAKKAANGWSVRSWLSKRFGF